MLQLLDLTGLAKSSSSANLAGVGMGSANTSICFFVNILTTQEPVQPRAVDGDMTDEAKRERSPR